MAGFTRMESSVRIAATRWLERVTPQLGESANFAQIDIDTLIPIRGAVKRELASFSVALFEALATDPIILGRELFLELSIPLNDGPLPIEITSESHPDSVLQYAKFDGNLRGRPVPGMFLSTWIPSDRRGPAWQRRVRLQANDAAAGVIHFREEGWTAEIDGGETDKWVERALEYRRYPLEPEFLEAIFP